MVVVVVVDVVGSSVVVVVVVDVVGASVVVVVVVGASVVVVVVVEEQHRVIGTSLHSPTFGGPPSLITMLP